MGKLVTYIILTVGIIILFNMAGLQTAGSVIANWGLEPNSIQNFQSGTFYRAYLIIALGSLAVSGIVMGIFGRSNPEIFITAAAAAPLLVLVGDMASITIAAGTDNFAGYFVWLIMAPLIAAYVISLYDWVRGRD